MQAVISGWNLGIRTDRHWFSAIFSFKTNCLSPILLVFFLLSHQVFLAFHVKRDESQFYHPVITADYPPFGVSIHSGSSNDCHFIFQEGKR